MKPELLSPTGLNAKGVGPQIMIRTAPFLLAAIYSEIKQMPLSEISFLSHPVVKNFGWIWLILGFTFFVLAIIQFSVNFPKGKLITNGMYSCSRNPIYSSWIVFIFPAVGLICNNWLFLLSAAVMCILTIFMVKQEEKQLLKCFGQAYSDYKKRVHCIVSFRFIKRMKN